MLNAIDSQKGEVARIRPSVKVRQDIVLVVCLSRFARQAMRGMYLFKQTHDCVWAAHSTVMLARTWLNTISKRRPPEAGGTAFSSLNSIRERCTIKHLIVYRILFLAHDASIGD